MRKIRNKNTLSVAIVGMIAVAGSAIKFVSPLQISVLILFAAVELFAWRLCIWPAVIVTDEKIVVRSFYRTHRIRWSEIKEFRAENSLRIDLLNGSSVSAIAVTQANFNLMFRREGFLGRTVKELEDLRKSKVGA